MSVDLQWELVRNFNSFMVKRSGHTFSTEPGNLTKMHSYKYSGLAQNKAVVVSPADKGVAICHRDSHLNKYAFTKPVVFKNTRRAAKALNGQLAGGFFRPDLMTAAKARACAILASKKDRKVFPKKRRANKQHKPTSSA